ncbi:alpha/beta hydrolase [Pedobacter yulinensis]|uniref:Alpha/beta hydrolase n=1 Tax=Pedobacter yulinensis TaxID=2126353 RepID=A0A2T3HKP2_9SPHI|nr:alpha/beta hydrolase [Pedobacter yulinensis]PST83025.1 alpha/beta hydrolase [Pedobacter yulinensis]
MPYFNLNIPENETSTASLYYEDWGAGDPVVLIHGWPLSHEMWEYQIDALVTAGYRVIAYDRRGFGKSAKTWTGYDYDTLTSDLAALIDGLALESVSLVGFSMGGGEVVRYLSRFGIDKIKKAVLISSVVPFMLKTDDHPEGVPAELFDGFAEKLANDRPAFLSEFAKQFYGEGLLSKPVSQHILNWHQNLSLQASARATERCLQSFSRTDFRCDLDKIRIPLLVIHGDADKTVPIEATSAIVASRVPQAEYTVLEGAPHGLFITDRDMLNQRLIDFLGQ